MSRQYFVGKKKWQPAVAPHPDRTASDLSGGPAENVNRDVLLSFISI